MLLWNDYEGKTVAETFPLKKLLRPEGRSAFFTTARPDGQTDIIRLTESLNDQDELLARWRQIVEADQPNLITIKRFGQTTFDGVPLTYALMESTDASLAEILRERPLTPAETIQVATSVSAALNALHHLQLTHGQIEPSSIHASGETIKLRSDCVRECIPDPEFNPESVCQERRQLDVHDLGVLLLQCLTLEKTLTPQMRLPSPFHVLIPHALDGSWTLDQIAESLSTPAEKPLVPAALLENHTSLPTPVRPVSATPDAFAPGPRMAHRQLDLDYATETVSHRSIPAWALNPRLWLVAAAGLLLLILVGYFAGRATKPAPQATAAAVARPVVASGNVPAVVVAGPARQPAVGAAAGWHVIAFTYNREPQAFAKVAELQRRHPNLHAEVFSPNGRAPYYAAIGGAMSRTQAEAVVKIARREGLPRDTFLHQYGAR